MKPLHIETPLHYAQTQKNKTNKDIYYKLDALQPTGSFKIRGIGRVCQIEKEKGMKQFVASSGGNSGIAVAYAGQKLHIPTTVFIPSTSNPCYIDLIKMYHAEVIVAGDVFDAAHEKALAFAEEHHAAYIHPFDNPIIWEGHASLIDEVAKQGVKPDAVIAAVGGGGLACGILQGMHQHNWKDVPLIAVGTQGADAFYQSILAKKIVTLSKVTSKATSLGAKRITNQLWDWQQKHEIHAIAVSDDAAENACRQFAKEERVLVEISAGAPLSLIYDNHPILKAYQTILVVVCGGVNTGFLLR